MFSREKYGQSGSEAEPSLGLAGTGDGGCLPAIPAFLCCICTRLLPLVDANMLGSELDSLELPQIEAILSKV
jgi:hypothetical protein